MSNTMIGGPHVLYIFVLYAVFLLFAGLASLDGYGPEASMMALEHWCQSRS